MQVKLLLVTFCLNGRLHAVSMEKPSEQMSNFWTVQFLKTESKPNFSFPHIPTDSMSLSSPTFTQQDLEEKQYTVKCCVTIIQGH